MTADLRTLLTKGQGDEGYAGCTERDPESGHCGHSHGHGHGHGQCDHHHGGGNADSATCVLPKFLMLALICAGGAGVSFIQAGNEIAAPGSNTSSADFSADDFTAADFFSLPISNTTAEVQLGVGIGALTAGVLSYLGAIFCVQQLYSQLRDAMSEFCALKTGAEKKQLLGYLWPVLFMSAVAIYLAVDVGQDASSRFAGMGLQAILWPVFSLLWLAFNSYAVVAEVLENRLEAWYHRDEVEVDEHEHCHGPTPKNTWQLAGMCFLNFWNITDFYYDRTRLVQGGWSAPLVTGVTAFFAPAALFHMVDMIRFYNKSGSVEPRKLSCFPLVKIPNTDNKCAHALFWLLSAYLFTGETLLRLAGFFVDERSPRTVLNLALVSVGSFGEWLFHTTSLAKLVDAAFTARCCHRSRHPSHHIVPKQRSSFADSVLGKSGRPSIPSHESETKSSINAV